jgi:CRISPR/Cas system CMR-associated protein Cmr5 small subunit
MGSGLMSALAFWQSRKEDPAKQLVRDLIGWGIAGETTDFTQAMNWLTKRSSAEYMTATDETLALLRWLRQCVDAVAEAEPVSRS